MLEERLRAVPLLRRLPGERLAEVARAVVEVEHRAGSVIFRMGDPADALYLVDDGQLAVARAGERVAVLGPGSVAGEMGLLLDEVRSADLIALTDTRLWSLGRDALHELLDLHPDLSIEMSRQLSARLAATTNLLAPDSTPVVVIAAWGTDRLDAFLDEFETMTGQRPLVVPEGGSLPREGATGGHVVAVLPPSAGRASRSVLRAATYVVCFREPPEWVVRRHPATHVLRCDGKIGVTRAARWAAGRSIGLALSSGGSKTVAHVGAVNVLRENDVAFDLIAGSSGGALVALAVGCGHGSAVMRRHLTELADLLSFRRWDVNVPPRTGVLKGRRLRDAFDRWFEGRTFDDLVLPTVVVATDLSTGAEVVIDSGPLADAARASLSIPGVFDPWTINGRPVIDGAVVSPLPTGVLRDHGVAVVVASNVAGKAALDEGAATLAEPPGVLQTMLRMISLMERELLKTQLPLADVVVSPRVAAAYSFDFTRIDEFVAEGERAAREAIASLGSERGVLFA